MVKRWIVDHEETLIDSPFVKMLAQDCHASDEPTQSHRFYVMRSRDWCNVVPVTADGKAVLIRQFRIGAQRETLEIPGGVADPADGDLAQTALRELAEETGYTPLPGARCEKLASLWANPAIQDNRLHNFIAGPVVRTGAQHLDPQEGIEILEVPLEEIPGLLRDGKLDHALIAVAFLQLLLRGDLVNELRAFTRV